MTVVILAPTLEEARAAARTVHARPSEWIYPSTDDALTGLHVSSIVRVDGWMRSPDIKVAALRLLPMDAWEIETLSRRQAALATTGVKLEQKMLARERARKRRPVVQVSPEQVAQSTEYAAPVKRAWWRRG